MRAFSRTNQFKKDAKRALKRLSVQFRGMGVPEQEIAVTATVKQVADASVVTDTIAAQGENKIIRNAEAELELE